MCIYPSANRFAEFVDLSALSITEFILSLCRCHARLLAKQYSAPYSTAIPLLHNRYVCQWLGKLDRNCMHKSS